MRQAMCFAYSGAIADIDSTPLPVVSTVAAATSALVASPSLDNVTNLDVTSALAIAFDYLYDSSLGGGSSTAASNYRSANRFGSLCWRVTKKFPHADRLPLHH